ncbi:hypothetical protein AP058_00008 [Flavobacterium sp. TAB 87]|nr:hypothetical protein AP058_00008 [Flavobacterium sp. TAB 87]
MAACECMSTGLMNQLGQATFAAKVKILKINLSQNPDYLDADIEILDLYKGQRTTTIKIHNPSDSMCKISPAEGEIWLVLTPLWQGISSVMYCSGSVQIDKDFSPFKDKYPNAELNHMRSINKKLSVLKYLKQHSIDVSNKFNLDINTSCDLTGYETIEEFAIYRITVRKDLSIRKITNLKGFDNATLSETITKCLQTSARVGIFKKEKVIPEEHEVILALYYYPSDEEHQSFISPRDF